MPTAAPRPVESLRTFGLLRRLSLASVAACAAMAAAGSVVGCSTPPVEQQVERGPLEPGSFSIDWKVKVDEGRYGKLDRLYRRGDIIVAYTDKNTVIVVGAESGQTVFIDPTIARRVDRLYPPLRLDALGRLGNVQEFLAFPRGDTYVLRSMAGEPISETKLPRNLTGAGAAADGVVYVGSADDNAGRLLQIDPTKPAAQVLSRVQFPVGISSKPAIFQGLIYAADEQGTVYGLDEELRSVWPGRSGAGFQTESGRGIEADLAADSYGVYAAGTDGTLYALDRQRGRLRWRFLAGRALYTRPVPSGDYVYQYVPDDGVVAIKKAEGSFNSRQPAWTAEGTLGYLSSDNRRVYLLQSNHSISAHDVETGEELYRTRRSDYTTFARNMDDDRIFAATDDGHIVAVKPINARGQVGEFALAPSRGASPRG